MLKININNRYYELPMEELYINNFSSYIKEDIIDLNVIENQDLKYKKTDELYGYISNSFTILFGSIENYVDFNYKDISSELLRKISSVDNLQRFFYKKGNIEKSINIMNEFMGEMLEFYNKVINEKNEIDSSIKR